LECRREFLILLQALPAWPNKEKNLTFHHDHLNSVTAVTGHDGTTVETASYGPFGNMESETSPALSGGEVANKLRYTGREFDRETGLYYYRARYYDPESGRFYTEDPLQFRAGINFYAYVDNNPINANDPTGLLSVEHHFGITLAAAYHSGMGFDKSTSIAAGVAARDFIDNSFLDTSKEIQNLHGTGGYDENGEMQSSHDVFQNVQTNLNKFISDGNFAQALHLVQDWATPMHQEKGFEGTSDFVGTSVHVWNDVFPTQDTKDLAYQNSLVVIDAIQHGHKVQLGFDGSVFALPDVEEFESPAEAEGYIKVLIEFGFID